MTFLAHLCLLCIFLFHVQNTRAKVICNSISCGDIDIQFPFGLKGSNQDRRCSYYPNPSYQLSCDNNSRTILNLPYTGVLVVKSIDYEVQTIQVNDPDGCLPKRFLNNWNLSESPFRLDPNYQPFNLTFLRCPSNVTESFQLPLSPISCLSDPSNSNSSSVIVSWTRPIVSSTLSQRCQVISSALVPLRLMYMPMWPYWPDLNSDIGLQWNQPRCRECAVSGQVCGFANDKTLQLGCFSAPSTKKGISRSAKYGLAIGVGIPGLLCLIGLSCFICGKTSVFIHRRRRNTELPGTISLEPIPFAMGLDGATIEKYPKTLVGESGRLLKPNDNTCSICLSEYEPKETLRSIPECSHYFHADCIDEWLKMNGTCPLCRNSPDTSSTVTSSFSSLNPTSPLSSSP
ncbi:RING-H2 finger protein ATL20-like [Gastrolobium bilobum]|uniref:RING-H2 finger protein ATL20-like n=1 Tax=Gastrolobium bilobum TaxID=150636 RepID=UPI002AB0B76A|nr:RING-H2 finger protein ATL20-like [Gastrolobium bilobum]